MIVQDDIETDDDERGPLRTCIVTRAKLPPEALIRFVAGPEGNIVPDLGGRLPGRGVWVTCDRSLLADAIKRRSFAKSLKKAVLVDDNLVAQVEGLLVKRAQNALSLANKAGLAVAGFAKVDALSGSGEAQVLVHACDAAHDGANKLDRKQTAVCLAQNRPFIVSRTLNSQQLGLALGRELVIHVGLKSGGATTNSSARHNGFPASDAMKRLHPRQAMWVTGPATSAVLKSSDTGQE